MKRNILAFDTSGPHCAVAIVMHDGLALSEVEEMTRGQAERLVPMIEALMSRAGLGWQGIDTIGVCTGPGNFTGIRIAVSLARGLALSRGVPAIGVSAFAAASFGKRPPFVACVQGPRDQVYVRITDAERKRGDPAMVEAGDMPRNAGPELWRPEPRRLVEVVARIAAARADTPQPPPAPLYVKPADAAPASDPPPVILP